MPKLKQMPYGTAPAAECRLQANVVHTQARTRGSRKTQAAARNRASVAAPLQGCCWQRGGPAARLRRVQQHDTRPHITAPRLSPVVCAAWRACALTAPAALLLTAPGRLLSASRPAPQDAAAGSPVRRQAGRQAQHAQRHVQSGESGRWALALGAAAAVAAAAATAEPAPRCCRLLPPRCRCCCCSCCMLLPCAAHRKR